MQPKVVFVGAFQSNAQDGSVGGQLYACRTLVNSPVSEHIDWALLDSTMESLPPPPFRRRLFLAVKRLFKFVRIIRASDVSGALIFTSARLSFVEKGLMVVLARVFKKYVVLSPRSGLILDDLHNSVLMRWFVPFVLRRCNLVMCQSQSWKELYQSLSGLPDSRFAVIPNWLDVKPYRQLDRPSAIDRNASVTFLYLGWLERYKGIYDLIEAVARSREQLGGSRFIICGRGSERALAEQKVREYRLDAWFEFRGWVTGEEKTAVLAESDVLVLPSHREGLPNALLEAMAAGLAVIATRVGAIPEVVTNNKTGLLVDAGDVEKLGLSLIELCRDFEKREAIGRNARAYVFEHRDVNVVWSRVLQMFDPIRGNKH